MKTKLVKSKTEEELFTGTKQDLKDIFDAGCAYATGTHKDLEQVNPDFEEWFAKNKKKYQQENN